MSRPTPAAVIDTPTSPTGRVANVAHRGASAQVAENTLAAVRRAVDLGSDFVELDVQRTKDGVLILMHDTTLDRTTNARVLCPDRAPWAISDFTYDELRLLDAGSWKSPALAGEPVPTLREALEVLHRSGAGLLLELKAPQRYPGIVSDVVEALHEVPGYLGSSLGAGRLAVQSFDVVAMKELKTQAPAVPVGLLGIPAKSNLPALATWADQVNPPHLSVTREYVDQVHRLGMECHVWTVNRELAMSRALRMGVDGIITNRPGVLARVMSERSAESTYRATRREVISPAIDRAAAREGEPGLQGTRRRAGRLEPVPGRGAGRT